MKITLIDETESTMTRGAPGAAGAAAGSPGSDSEVWDRIRAGDQHALGELFDRYADDVHAFAFRRTASWAAAEDVVQATFLNTWRRFQHRDPGPLTGPTARGWLLIVAGNECRNLTRTARRFRAVVDRLPAPTHDPDHAADVARRLDDERRMSTVCRALAKLPRHERETLELVVWSGLTMAEAASALGIAEGTVKARLHRARRRLTDLLPKVALSEELS